VSYHTKSVRASQSKPDRGVVVSLWKAVNQHGELVATVEGMGMFGRRAAGTEGGHA
jgi:acyl dehydratase